MKLFTFLPAVGVALVASGALAQGDEMPEDARFLQQEWAKVNYDMPEDARADAMLALVSRCDAMPDEQARPVETVIWCGIVRSSYAGMASPFSAMKYAKAARKDFEQAIEMDASALAGSAYTSLGTLYYKVPGWPVGFGDDEEAAQYLEQGLGINPEGIDPNYFYGEYLYEQGDYAGSREHLLKAQAAPPRSDRPLADKGRQQEIQVLLSKVDGKLKA